MAKFVWWIFGGIQTFIIYLILSIVVGLFNKELGAKLKEASAYGIDPAGTTITGDMKDAQVPNIVLIFFGGLYFLVYGFVGGFITKLFDKELGSTIMGNAMCGLSMASNAYSKAAPAAAPSAE